jgi:O-acetyl-ADP-ribose deacetylase (regulator of RNase III)
MAVKIRFLKGDITGMAVDAIVNATNTDLAMDSGVAGAIRQKGGEKIQEACERLGPLRLGAAAVTIGGNLKAHYVIHPASLRPGEKATAESIRQATHQSLMRAEEKTFRSVAFPALGTGVGGVSAEECAQTMLHVVVDHIKMRTSLEQICFVLFDDATLKVFEETFQKLTGRPAAGKT